MTFEDEWKKLKQRSSDERAKISAKYQRSSKQIENWDEEAELAEERKRFYAQLEKLKQKYGR